MFLLTLAIIYNSRILTTVHVLYVGTFSLFIYQSVPLTTIPSPR